MSSGSSGYERIALIEGDITAQVVDAIINAANTSLLGGGGVDGAIHRAAGPDLLAECRTLGGCETGSAKITRGYNLPARHVIHAVGPRYRDGQHGEAELLAGCYRTSLQLAVDNDCKSVAFPAISCGIYGYPMEEAATKALGTTVDFLADDDRINKVLFVLFGTDAHQVFSRVYDRLSALSETD